VTRLSSGLRINSAADDAAGLFLSKKLESQVRGLQQASRNAQDGMSLVQTAEGALNVTHSMLLRMRELAVQSANGVLSSTDRAAIADEVSTLTDEITRLANTTSFNGMKLLDGTNGGAQVTGIGTNGKGANVAITDNTDTEVTGATTNAVGGTAGLGDAIVAANGIVSIMARTADATQPVAYRIAAATGGDYDNATDTTVLELQVDDGTGTFSAVATATVTGVSQIGGAKLVSFAGTDVQVLVNANLAAATTATTGALENANMATANNNFVVSNNLDRLDTDTTTAGTQSTSSLDIGLTGVVLQVGANNVSSDQLTLLNMNAMTADGLGLTSYVAAGGGMGTYSISENVKTQSGAQNAIDIIDNAIEMVSQQRSKIGAFQNRMEYTITNLGVAAENQAAANSRIVDADVAAEVSNMVKTQILSQSAMAVLAQANAAPQALLSLLS
jgi:flagellin